MRVHGAVTGSGPGCAPALVPEPLGSQRVRFHATGKGRILAGLFVGAYALTVHSSPDLALVALLVLALISPWFMWKSL